MRATCPLPTKSRSSTQPTGASVVATVGVTCAVVVVIGVAVEVVVVPAIGAQAANDNKPAKVKDRMSARVRPGLHLIEQSRFPTE